MPDGSKWDVPVQAIIDNRAAYYKGEGEDPGTPDDDEILDWAPNNMNWDEVAKVAERAKFPLDVDYQEGWINGEREIVD